MQHSVVGQTQGQRPVAIEVDGEPVGVVVAAPEGLRFLAVRYGAFSIDGRVFSSVQDAARAAAQAMSAREP